MGSTRRPSWSKGKTSYIIHPLLCSLLTDDVDTLPQLRPALRARQGGAGMVAGSAPSRYSGWSNVKSCNNGRCCWRWRMDYHGFNTKIGTLYLDTGKGPAELGLESTSIGQLPSSMGTYHINGSYHAMVVDSHYTIRSFVMVMVRVMVMHRGKERIGTQTKSLQQPGESCF